VRKLKWLLLLLSAIVIAGCEDNPPPTLPPATPGGGFIVETKKTENGGPPITDPSVEIDGDWQRDLVGAAGDPSHLTVITNTIGLAAAGGKRAPANWKFTWTAAPDDSEVCARQTLKQDVALDGIAYLQCDVTTVVILSAAAFSFSPNPVYTLAAPPTGTVSGQGLTTTYGMPMVQYYKMDGTFVGQENATSVSSGGTSMQISGFNISHLPSGAYAGFVSNAAPGGVYNYVGTGAVTVVVGAAPATGWITINGSEQTYYPCAGNYCPNYDRGSVHVILTQNGATIAGAGAPFSSLGDTTSSLASTIANNLNSSGKVTATVSGSTVYLTSVATGSASNYSISVGSISVGYNNGWFSHPSFTITASGPTLTGGAP
jgi:hypothetical protein